MNHSVKTYYVLQTDREKDKKGLEPVSSRSFSVSNSGEQWAGIPSSIQICLITTIENKTSYKIDILAIVDVWLRLSCIL